MNPLTAPSIATESTEIDSRDNLEHQVLSSIRSTATLLADRQATDGHWPGDYGGPLFLLPGLLIAYEITGTQLDEKKRDRMIAYLRNVQNADGGFGLHLEGPSTVFGTALNYVAWRILGEPADNPRLVQARRWLREHGGAEAIPSWGKFWLAVLGVYRWEGLNPLLPELWLLPNWLPIHPGKFWCHTRHVFLPMSYLYGRRATGPETTLVQQLRQEVFTQPWHTMDWTKLRDHVADTDLYTPHSKTLRKANKLLNAYERHAPKSLRERALKKVLDHIEHQDESTGYLTIGPVSKPIHLLARWFDNPRSQAVSKHIRRMDDYLWDGERGLHMQGYNGSHFWDLAFAMQAILANGLHTTGEFLDILRPAYSFLDNNQVKKNVSHHKKYYRDATVGTWPFSTAEQAWSVSDCTAEGLKVALKMAPFVKEPLSDDRLFSAADALLRSQNRDGGWSEYEAARGPSWLEAFNAAEVFGDIMIGHSYVECTSACLQGLVAFRNRFPNHRSTDIQASVDRGANFLRSQQRDDGSWYGGWGVCFTYGTWFAIDGLAAVGDPQDIPRIQRASRFLIEKQRADGGWGESYLSCSEKRWIDHEETQFVQTAWALLGLLSAQHYLDVHTGTNTTDPKDASTQAGDNRPHKRYPNPSLVDPAAIERGMRVLLRHQKRDGSWPHQQLCGVFNRNCMIHYDNYRFVMPLWALSRYYASKGAVPFTH